MNIRHLQVRDLEPGEFFILGREVMHPRVFQLIDHARGMYARSSLCLEVETGKYTSLDKHSFTIRSNP